MAIGIIDLDLILFTGSYKLNLDVMQISGYYKRKGEKVQLCRSMKSEDLLWFKELMVVYNGETEVFIDNLIKDERVTLIGKYFYGKNLTLPVEILNTYPDKNIYNSILDSDYFSPTKRRALKAVLKKADFLRLHIPSNLNFISKDSTEIFLYDQDISDVDYEKIVSIGKEFSIYFPIEIRSYQNAQKWLNAKAFKRGDNTHMFIANHFIESDLEQLLTQTKTIRKMFRVKFGECSPEYYNLEAKKMLRFLQKAKLLEPTPKIIVEPLNDEMYNFLFTCIRKWYNGKRENLDKDIFHTYFKTKKQFEFMNKIKITDLELYKLLTSTITTRYQNEQIRTNYRRMD